MTHYSVSHIPNCCGGEKLLYHLFPTVVAVTSCCITYPQLLWWWLAIVSHIPNCCSGDQLLYHISPTVVAVTRYFLSHIPNCCSVDSQFYWKVLSFFSTFSDNVRVTCDNLLAWKHVGVRLLRQLSRVPSSAYCIINMNSVYGLVFTRHFNLKIIIPLISKLNLFKSRIQIYNFPRCSCCPHTGRMRLLALPASPPTADRQELPSAVNSTTASFR